MFLHLPHKRTVYLTSDQLADVLSESGRDAYFTNEGRIVNQLSDLQSEHVFLNVKLCGGKGAFGSLLRFIGSQIEKTTNREAMRDLSGRRLHDVNNEQRLQDWNERQQERERQREVEKEERLQKLREGPKHNFTDQKYFDQSASIRNNLEDALTIALQNADSTNNASQGTSKVGQKRGVSASRGENSSSKSGKKSKGIMDMGLPDDSDSDSDSSEASDENVPVVINSQKFTSTESSCNENQNTFKRNCAANEISKEVDENTDSGNTDCEASLEPCEKNKVSEIDKELASESYNEITKTNTEPLNEASIIACKETSNVQCLKEVPETNESSENERRKRKVESESTSVEDSDTQDVIKKNKIVED